MHKFQKNSKLLNISTLDLNPALAYNINSFNNYYLSVIGDYNFIVSINSKKYFGIQTKLDFSSEKESEQDGSYKKINTNSPILTTILLQNIIIQGKFYENIILGISRKNIFNF